MNSSLCIDESSSIVLDNYRNVKGIKFQKLMTFVILKQYDRLNVSFYYLASLILNFHNVT